MHHCSNSLVFCFPKTQSPRNPTLISLNSASLRHRSRSIVIADRRSNLAGTLEIATDRSRKRPEAADELPVDKRPCNSSAASSSSSPAAPAAAPPASSHPAVDMDEDASDQSDYGDSDDEPEPEHAAAAGAAAPGGEGKFQRIVASLGDSDPGALLASLMELCEVLSFCMEDSIHGFPTDATLPVLVRLVNYEASPDVMLLAVRALTYLCDAMPRSADAIVRHGALPVLCSRLLAIEYLDVAEQCLQALEKISRRQPVPCLQAGAINAVLAYIDFFSTSIQRVALSTVANICKKLPVDCSGLVMESVPTLCNLLQYEDRKLVETVVTCLIRISDCFSNSPDLLDELCHHGVISKSVHLIAADGWTSVSQATYTGLIGLLTKLAARSLVAVRVLFELNVSRYLRAILAASGLSRGTISLEDAQSNQVSEVLKLLNQLIPPLARDNDDMQLVLAKEKIIVDQPEFLHRFTEDILPVSIQVVNSGANQYVCYGCVSIINNIVYFSKPDTLLNLLTSTNISSFLAGLLARKDHHLLILTLKIIESLMQKLPGVFTSSFIKEGVIYTIDAFLALEHNSSPRTQQSSQTQLQDNQHTRNVPRCLCYAFDSSRSSSPEAGACRLGKDTLLTLAKHIKATYFSNESMECDTGLTEVLQKLKIYCAVLNDNIDKASTNDGCAQNEEYLTHVLDQVMSEVNGGETMSTFEFIESGIVKSLAHYLCNGSYLQGSPYNYDVPNNSLAVLKRFQTFACISLSKSGQNREGILLTLLVQKLQSALSSSDNFPVILSHGSKPKNTYAHIPVRRSTMQPCLKVRFMREEGETDLCEYDALLNVELSSSLDAIEEYLWPKVSKNNNKQAESVAKAISETEERNSQEMDASTLPEPSVSSSSEGVVNEEREPLPVDSSTEPRELVTENIPNLSSTDDGRVEGRSSASSRNADARPKLSLFLEGKQLDRSITLYQAIIQDQISAEPDIVVGPKLLNEIHKVTYKTAVPTTSDSQMSCDPSQSSLFLDITGFSWQKLPFFSSILLAELPCKLEKSNPSYDILFMLKILEGLNRFSFHLLSYERINAFAEGRICNFDDLKVAASSVPQSEFINSKLTDKLEQQLRDPLALTAGSMPSWCSQLMAVCPFLFSFEARRKYFSLGLTASVSSRIQQNQMQHSDSSNTNSVSDRRSASGSFSRKKFRVNRSKILESAAKMMASHACSKAAIEVEYAEEVGTGLGPTMEFYTLVSHEFQKIGLGMWREDQNPSNQSSIGDVYGDFGFVVAPFGLFPRPWSEATSVSNGISFSEVIKKFVLLGQLVAKAIKDGRILDMPLSRAFYKVILEQELGIYDIQSFDLELGRTLLEFQALINKKKYLKSLSRGNLRDASDLCFRNTKIEDLCLDFTLPGYSDYVLTSKSDLKTVNITNLDEYVSLVVDATIRNGISRQVEAFKSGFNEVFPLEALRIFTENELERLLCGEQDTWNFSDLLEYIKFDHGYTASSPPTVNLLEIMQEFGGDERRAFLQFVTGAPRLPPGGLAALNPKLTIVRKHCSSDIDTDLPSVMTCANYLKLPPYSSKERMKQRLLYAIKEGQGSFHLS